jgi:hypothetical protein
MITYGTIGLCLGIGLGIILYNRNYALKTKYVVDIILRYGAAYFLLAYGISQILDTRYPESLLAQDTIIADMLPGQFVWTFFGYTYAYQAFLGYTQLLACSLLFFRFTTPLGLLIIMGVLSNALMINYSYNLCSVADATMFLALAVYLFIPFLKNFLNVMVLNRPASNVSYPYMSNGGHGYRALNILKFVIIIGILTYYYNPYRRYLRYYHSNADSPIVGVWNIEDIQYDTSKLNGQEEYELKSFKSLFLERRRLGAVKTQDSLSYFEYMIDTTYHQLEFWNFHEFRDLDLKGKYFLPSPDTMIYKGYNNKDSIKIIMSLDKRYKIRKK